MTGMASCWRGVQGGPGGGQGPDHKCGRVAWGHHSSPLGLVCPHSLTSQACPPPRAPGKGEWQDPGPVIPTVVFFLSLLLGGGQLGFWAQAGCTPWKMRQTDRVLKVGWCAQLAMADAGAESLSLSPSHVLTHEILTPTLFSTPSSSE